MVKSDDVVGSQSFPREQSSTVQRVRTGCSLTTLRTHEMVHHLFSVVTTIRMQATTHVRSACQSLPKIGWPTLLAILWMSTVDMVKTGYADVAALKVYQRAADHIVIRLYNHLESQ